MGNTPKKNSSYSNSGTKYSEKLADFIEKSVENIYLDRHIAYKFLKELEGGVLPANKTQEWVHSVAAKYIETMQRSNEQLVKITAIISRKIELEESSDISEEIDTILEENTKSLSEEKKVGSKNK